MISRTVYALVGIMAMAGVSHAETTLEKSRRQGYVTMGFTNEIPYSYSEEGKLTGADTEVARVILAKMGIPEVVGVLTEFQSLIPGVLAKRFDLNSTMYIRPSPLRADQLYRSHMGGWRCGHRQGRQSQEDPQLQGCGRRRRDQGRRTGGRNRQC